MKAILLSSLSLFVSTELLGSAPDELQRELRAIELPLNVCSRAIPGTVGGVVAPSVPLAYGYAGGLPMPVAAASTLGRGRIVAVGHGAFLNKESMDAFAGNRVFREASLRWLADGQSPAKVWIDRTCANLASGMEAPGRVVETVEVPKGLAKLPENAVVVMSPESHGVGDVLALRAFIERGGGVLCRVVGWGWHQMNPGKSLKTDNVYNLMFAGTGLVTDDRTQDPTGKDGFETRPTFDPILEFLGAWQADPVRLWPTRPEAAVYPGLPPPGSARLTRTVDVDLAVPRWHGTGLFAVAGERLSVSLPEGAEKLGLKLRVGTTECRNTGKRPWKRAPVVDVTVPLNARSAELASPFGGLVYVVVPDGLSGNVAVEIGPACPAPSYVLGRDTAETWRMMRTAPAPMAELASDKIVLTVPSDVIRNLDDPAPLLETWNTVIDLDAKLTGLPAYRKYPERMCADVQLCCGAMHSGYPIMFPVTAAKDIVDNETLRHAKTGNVWGFYHEMGHNHQNRDWTFDGSVEVTVNLFTLYCYDRICGLPPRKTRIGEAKLAVRVKDWEAKGRPLDEWKKDPFLALDFFVCLQERYGWEPFEKMFAEYRTLKPEERPKTDLEKRRQWAQRFSRIVGEDLTKEFAFLTEK